MTLDAAGGSVTVAVQTATPCRWTAAPAPGADSWITAGAGTSVGPGTLALTLQPNRSFAGRSGAVVITNERGHVLATHTIGQRAAGCLYSVSPTVLTLNWWGTYDAAEDSSIPLRIQAEPADCRWVAVPSVPWIKIVYSPSVSTGDGQVYVSVTGSNLTSSTRAGAIAIAGLSGVNPDVHVAVTQYGGRAGF